MSVRADPAPIRRVNPVGITALLLVAAFVAWAVTIDRMQGMDAGPGTDLGGLGWYLGVWVTMMAAMMLPSVAPMVLVFSRLTRERARLGRAASVPTWIFLVGYLGVWTGYGLVAYGIFRLVKSFDPAFLSWHEQGPYVAGAAIAVAGLYQLTPLKEVCLRHCRTPLHYIFGGWKQGRLGALRMGTEHGAYCVGCCWGLMVVLFAVGVMSIFWMAVIAGVIFVEKIFPYGVRLARLVAVALIVFGVWIAVSPSSVPGLTDPGSAPAMQMERMAP